MSNDLKQIHFGRLTVISWEPGQKAKVSCICGNEKIVMRSNLRSGGTTSCGCLHKEVIGALRRTHGKRWTPEYFVWLNMRSRCMNPKNKHYKDYGGRGIKICDRWDSFSLFLEDMGSRPSPKHRIDRKDNDGSYSPENCRWVTEHFQQRNKRSNQLITHKGKTMCLVDWQNETGIPRQRIAYRIKMGWSMDDVFGVTPILGRNSH